MKKFAVIAISLLVVGGAFVGGLAFGKKKQSDASNPVGDQNVIAQRAETGSAILHAKITSLKTKPEGSDVSFRLVEWTQGADNAEQAALESGQCTLDKIENDECLPNNFFVRETGKSLVLAAALDAEFLVLSPGPSGEIKLDADHNTLPRSVSIAEFAMMLADSQYADAKPFVITTSRGIITKIQEQYVP